MDKYYGILLPVIAVIIGGALGCLPFDRIANKIKMIINYSSKDSTSSSEKMSFSDVKKRVSPKNEGKPTSIVVENLKRDLGDVEYSAKTYEDKK